MDDDTYRIESRLDRDLEREGGYRSPALTPRGTLRALMVDRCPVDHAAVKLDDAAWSALTPIGVQHIPADGDEPAETLELAKCRCGSTLARRVLP